MHQINYKAIRQAALHTLNVEIEALIALRSSINRDFCQVVEAIFHSKGRVVVSGIGKSAIVAQKIVATLNSTGTPALFMHAADAVHGDLGMIQPEDIVLCLSKSGDTAEIRILVPFLKSRGNLLVGMSACPDSHLGKHADFLLKTPVSREADPNDLAPTASTTAQMAMGDALAVALLSLRGFSPEDFAQVHPGGTLGKQLYLRLDDIFPHHERPLVREETGIHDTILEMTSKRLGCAVIVDHNNKVSGIVTDGDLRRMLERFAGQDFSKLKARDVMSAHPKTLDQNELAVHALEVMRLNSITQVVVTREGEYVGIVHLHDLIREGIV